MPTTLRPIFLLHLLTPHVEVHFCAYLGESWMSADHLTLSLNMTELLFFPKTFLTSTSLLRHCVLEHNTSNKDVTLMNSKVSECIDFDRVMSRSAWKLLCLGRLRSKEATERQRWWIDCCAHIEVILQLTQFNSIQFYLCSTKSQQTSFQDTFHICRSRLYSLSASLWIPRWILIWLLAWQWASSWFWGAELLKEQKWRGVFVWVFSSNIKNLSPEWWLWL